MNTGSTEKLESRMRLYGSAELGRSFQLIRTHTSKGYAMLNNLFIVWGDINKTGIKIIDEQHRGIVSVINSLYFFIRHKHGENMIFPILELVRNYTQIHFKLEETMLAKAKYPELEAHKKHHAAFVAGLYKEAHAAKIHEDPYALLELLKNWWIDHINKEDHAYAAFILKVLQTQPEFLQNK